MRIMLKAAIPVEHGNREVLQGTLATTMKSILDDMKPEAAYFVAENGKRTGIFFVNIQDASEIPRIAEPLFLAFGAHVECTPAMIAQDLAAASPAIEKAAKKYGGAAQSAGAR